MQVLRIHEEQALYFRARRSCLTTDGAATPAAAARRVMGVQAQQLEPALFALAQRTTARSNGARWSSLELQELLFDREQDPSIVRTWGQRDTVHIYDVAAHWRKVIAARPLWPNSGRKGPMPPPALLENGIAAMRSLGRAATRKDLLEVVKGQPYTSEVTENASSARQSPEQFAAGRVLWQLAYAGTVCSDAKVGSEQTYQLREQRFSALDWGPIDAEVAAVQLVRDYLRVYAPATAKDVAHHFGTRVTAVRTWFDVLRGGGELVEVSCGARNGLVALAADVDALSLEPPKAHAGGEGDWPLRILPKFDTMLMGHHDKTWTVPHQAECGAIWGRAAQVLATVLARGRLVATWGHKRRAKDVVVTLQPLSGWDDAWRDAFEAEAAIFARHLGSPKVTTKYDD